MSLVMRFGSEVMARPAVKVVRLRATRWSTGVSNCGLVDRVGACC
jgi:hypothetical protein